MDKHQSLVDCRDKKTNLHMEAFNERNVNNNLLCRDRRLSYRICPRGGGGYSHTLPVRVCAAQRAPDLERGIHFTGVS